MSTFAKFTDSNLKEIVSPLFGTNYWIGLTVSIVVISSLFIFRGCYARLSSYNLFRYSLASLQLTTYFLDIYFKSLNNGFIWTEHMPFHLSSLLDLSVAFLLLYPTEKFFSLTFPLVGPVILAFLLPDKRVYGLDSFFYYQYYLNHLIIFFGFFYLYSYGHVKFQQGYLKQSCFFMTSFAIFVFVFNVVFRTNYLFIGSLGFSFSEAYWFLSTGNWNPVFRFLFMWLVGIMFILIFNVLITKYFPPYYLNQGQKLNEYYHNKVTLFSKIKNKVGKRKNSLGDEQYVD